jgi:hypothetical protein
MIHGRTGTGRSIRAERDQNVAKRRRVALEVRESRISLAAALCEDLDLRLANKVLAWSRPALDAVAERGQRHGTVAISSLVLRPRLMAVIDAACEHGARRQRDRSEGQAQLFGGFGEGVGGDAVGAGSTGIGDGLKTASLPEAPPWTETEQLAGEKETLGLYWSGHPVDRYASQLKALGARATGDLADAPVKGSRGDTWGPGGAKAIEADTSIGGIVAAAN